MKSLAKQPDSTSPRYREVEETLCDRIRRGELKPGDRLDSTKSLAQELNVGVGTINQALAALASRGLLMRRPRIGTVVSDDVDSLIRRPESDRSTAIYAVLVPDLRMPSYSGMIRHMQKVLRDEHIHVSVFNVEGGSEIADAAIRRCVDDAVDAVVLVPPLFSSISLEALVELKQSEIPVVTCWRPAGGVAWPMVQGDPCDVIVTPARHLLAKGCRNLVLLKDVAVEKPRSGSLLEPLAPDFDPLVQLEFSRALAEHGIIADRDRMLRVEHGIDAFEAGGLANQQEALDALTEWFRERPEIDGVLCTYDIVAGLVLEALARLGRKVPEDVAVTGGGNLRAYSWYFAASLTSIDPDLEAVAERACELLAAMRSGKKFKPGHIENVPWRLVEGDSTAR